MNQPKIFNERNESTFCDPFNDSRTYDEHLHRTGSQNKTAAKMHLNPEESLDFKFGMDTDAMIKEMTEEHKHEKSKLESLQNEGG